MNKPDLLATLKIIAVAIFIVGVFALFLCALTFNGGQT